MTDPVPEFSRILALGSVRAEGRALELEAEPGEREALARRFGIPAVESLRAELKLRPEPGGTIRASGRLKADVVQTCVVTLEPVGQKVDVPVELRLLPEGRPPADEDPDSPDEIESGPGGAVDLGEALAEQLSLALDPYPRAPGAHLPDDLFGEEGPQGPFAALARLRGGDGKRG